MKRSHPATDDLDEILAAGGVHTGKSLLAMGVARATLWRAVKAERVAQVVRGVFCSPDMLAQDGIRVAAISLANPGSVICLLSAAQLHDISDEDPIRVWVALPREDNKNPAKGGQNVPVQTVWWRPIYFESGIETRQIAGVPVRVTDLGRTVVDLIRNRTKIGDEPAMKALHDYVREGAPISDLWDRAKRIGHLDAVEPFVRAADEFRGSVTVRAM